METPISSNNFILCVLTEHFIDDRIKQHMTKLVQFSTFNLIMLNKLLFK
jgi:hypothetical protein